MDRQVQRILDQINGGARPCIDSRQARKGGIFFALQGEKQDGNRFAKDALENGCILACVDDPGEAADDRYVVVEDVLSLLQETAKAYRQQLRIPVLGITGSNGKTTTKELIRQVLSQSFHSVATQGNLNNHIGVPLTILSLDHKADIAVIEMGANHVGEIGELCRMARPTHGLITNIGKAHLEGFGSTENVFRAKTELFDYLREHGGTRFINTGSHWLEGTIGDGGPCVSYRMDGNAHCSGALASASPFLTMDYRVSQSFGKASGGMRGRVESRLAGKFNAENILAAITAGLFFGVPADGIARAVAGYVPNNHRSQIIRTRSNTVLMDAYNANPTSMQAALESFASFPGNPKAAIIGDMLELGRDAAREHREIRDLVLGNAFQHTIFVGAHFAAECTQASNVRVFADAKDAARWLAANPLTGHTIFMKGSRGIQLETLLTHL